MTVIIYRIVRINSNSNAGGYRSGHFQECLPVTYIFYNIIYVIYNGHFLSRARNKGYDIKRVKCDMSDSVGV